MPGAPVNKEMLDQKLAETIVAVRDAMQKVELLGGFLQDNPVPLDGVDPLALSTTPVDPTNPATAPGKFGYTVEEAKMIRDLFGTIDGVVVHTFLKKGRRMTGLL